MKPFHALLEGHPHRKPFILSMAQFNGKEWLFWLRNISNANVDIFHSQRVSKRINLDELDDCDYVNNHFSQSQGIFEALAIAYSFVSNKKKMSNVKVLERIPTDSFGQDGKPIYYLDKTGEIIESKLINDAVLRACFNFSDGQNEHWQFHYDGTTRDGMLFLLDYKG